MHSQIRDFKLSILASVLNQCSVHFTSCSQLKVLVKDGNETFVSLVLLSLLRKCKRVLPNVTPKTLGFEVLHGMLGSTEVTYLVHRIRSVTSSTGKVKTVLKGGI